MAQRDLNELDVPAIEDLVDAADGVFSREEIEAFVDYCRAAVMDAPEVERVWPHTITKEVALALGYRATIYSTTRKDSRGEPMKARVNGKVKTWKREVADPIEPRDHPKGDFILPCKYGMYDAFNITPQNSGLWTAEHPDDWPKVASSVDIVSRWLRHTQRGLVGMAHQFGERQRIGHLTLKKLNVRLSINEEDIETGALLERMRERDVQTTSEAYLDLKPQTKPITNLDDWTMGPWAYQVEQVDKKGEVIEAALYYVSDAVLPWSGRMTVRRRNPDDGYDESREGYTFSKDIHVPLSTRVQTREPMRGADDISTLFKGLLAKAPDAFPHPVALIVDEATALNGRDPHSRAHACAGINEDSGRGEVYIAPKLVTGCLDDGTELFGAGPGGARALRDRQVGVLAHELGHIALLFRGDEDHTERDADAEAERLFGKRINYDIEDVQTVGRGVHPRPKRLDVDENPGRPHTHGKGCLRSNPISKQPPSQDEILAVIAERNQWMHLSEKRQKAYAEMFGNFLSRLYRVWPSEMADHTYLLRASVGLPGGNLLVFQRTLLIWNQCSAGDDEKLEACAYVANLPGYELDMFKELGWKPSIDFKGEPSDVWYDPPDWVKP